jgi:CheY-like chemotaxis protein
LGAIHRSHSKPAIKGGFFCASANAILKELCRILARHRPICGLIIGGVRDGRSIWHNPSLKRARSGLMKETERILNVLIVDDNEDSAYIIKSLLEAIGQVSIRVAHEPMQALDVAVAHRPDLCLLDIGLPGMDGYDLAARLRKTLPKTVFVALSGRHRDESRELATGVSFSHFLQKPARLEALKLLLAEVAATR